MGELRCVDGSVLSVEAVTCRDKVGRPYEITLNLARDSIPFAAVGQRCGYQLSRLAERVSAARIDPAQAATWPDPDDRFPAPVPGFPDPAPAGDEPGPGSGAGREARPPRPSHLSAGRSADYVPGDHEYFALRSRDRGDPPGSGELRCLLRSSAVWLGDCAGVGHHPRVTPRVAATGHGSWRLTRRAVIEAWGSGGVGVRAVLTSAELVAFLDTVVRGLADVAADVPQAREVPAGDRPAGKEPGGSVMPQWRQRGRVPDGIARSRLPALRAQAGGGAVTPGGTAARRGDVRR
ncbi:MAG: hypothetical protein WBH47_04105 [Streptosporangiaceae bacterium]